MQRGRSPSRGGAPEPEEESTGEQRLGREEGLWRRGLTETEGPHVRWHRLEGSRPFLAGLQKEADTHLETWPWDLITQSQHLSQEGQRSPPQVPSAQHHRTATGTAGPTASTGTLGSTYRHGWSHATAPSHRLLPTHHTGNWAGALVQAGGEGGGAEPVPGHKA